MPCRPHDRNHHSLTIKTTHEAHRDIGGKKIAHEVPHTSNGRVNRIANMKYTKTHVFAMK